MFPGKTTTVNPLYQHHRWPFVLKTNGNQISDTTAGSSQKLLPCWWDKLFHCKLLIDLKYFDINV